jgi:hypothetical protein
VNRRFVEAATAALGAIMVVTGALVGLDPGLLAVAGFCAILLLLIRRADRRSQQIRLDGDGGGVLHRFVGERRESIPLRPGEVRVRVDIRRFRRAGRWVDVSVLILEQGRESHELMLERNDAERAWAADQIQRWLEPPGPTNK